MLKLKPGVRLTGVRPELLLAIVAAERLYADAGADLVLTSLNDSQHSPTSLHYAGAAVDLRTANLPNPLETASRLASRLAAALGSDFDVIHEADHLHIEWQPRAPDQP